MRFINLEECLNQAPEDHLRLVAGESGLDTFSRTEAIRILRHRLTDPAWLERIVDRLSPEEWAALKVVVFEGGEEGITVELCYQRINQVTGKRRKTGDAGVQSLIRIGLVFSRRFNYRQVYFVPGDVLSLLTQIFSRRLADRVIVSPERVSEPRELGWDLLRDLHRFLAFIHKNEIRLTQGGQIFKRQLSIMADLFTVPVAQPEPEFLGRYPEPLGLLISFAQDRALIVEKTGILKTAEGIQSWLKESPGQKLAGVFTFWKERYFYWHRDLERTLEILASLGNRWTSMVALAEELEPMLKSGPRGPLYPRLEKHMIRFLHQAGLLEVGRLDEGTAARLTTVGLALITGKEPPVEPFESRFHLQANYEVLVPRRLDPRLFWDMELCGDLITIDQALVYRLSRESIYRALRTGATGDGILDFLETHGFTPMPQNVSFAIRDWSQSYGQVYFQEACLLRCADETLARAVRASRRVGQYIVGQITSKDLVVDRRHYQSIMAGLIEDGLMPRPGIASFVPETSGEDALDSDDDSLDSGNDLRDSDGASPVPENLPGAYIPGQPEE